MDSRLRVVHCPRHARSGGAVREERERGAADRARGVVSDEFKRGVEWERHQRAIDNGGGDLDGSRSAGHATVPGTSPASALPPLTERPRSLDDSWRGEDFMLIDTAHAALAQGLANTERLYALSLKARLKAAEERLAGALAAEKAEYEFRREVERERNEARADRDALKAKLAEHVDELEDWRQSAKRASAGGHGDERHCSCVGPLLKVQNDLIRASDALRAKLDGVREALSDAIGTVGGARRSCVGDHYIHSPQVRTDQVDRWRSALAAAENTNTGDAIRAASKEASDGTR